MERTTKKKTINTDTDDKKISKIHQLSLRNKEELSRQPRSLKKWWIATSFGLLVAVSLFGYLGYKNLVLAWVDNTPITKFTLYKQLEDKYGKDFTEQLISEMLILKEAEAKGVQSSESEIDAEIKKIEDSQGGSEKLIQAMDAQNVTMEDLRKQIKYKQLIDKTFGVGSEVTEQEITEYMDKNKAQMPPMEGLSASESAQLKGQIKDSIKAEKVNKVFDDWLRDSLRGPRVKRIQANEIKLSEVKVTN